VIYTQIINSALKISPLAKDANGYVVIEAAWQRLLGKPSLPTEDFDALFFPPDQASEPFANGGRRCQVKASVTKNGPAEWVPHPFNKPCGHELESMDGYRRHTLTEHLSCCMAIPGDHCICEPWSFISVHTLIAHTAKRSLEAMEPNGTKPNFYTSLYHPSSLDNKRTNGSGSQTTADHPEDPHHA
jgi:hypothetical protein